MESKVKLVLFVRFAVRSLVAVVLLAMVAIPLSADTITVKSDLTNTGVSVGLNGYGVVSADCPTCFDPRLSSGDTTGLVFTPVAAGSAPTPSGMPSGTIQVRVPGGPDPDHNFLSGFIETTFNLPVDFHGASLTGEAFVDDVGYVYLNGHLISGEILSTGNASFATSLYFQEGINTLVISDWNEYGGASGATYYANINYNTPEPTSMLMLATGLAGLGGVIRRKLAK